MKLPSNLKDVNVKNLAKKAAFFAVFGVTGIVALAAYRYAKNKINSEFDIYFEPENWWV